MKKKFLLAALFTAFAMASYGGNALLAHAQTATTSMTATSSNATAVQQQLDDAKAELVQLQMQAGEVPAGDNGLTTGTALVTVTPTMPNSAVSLGTTTLTPTDVTEVDATLTALANLLTSLQTKIAQDPQFVTTDGPVVVSALQDIGGSIASIGSEVTGATVAMTSPTTMPSSGATAMTGTGTTEMGTTGSATAPATQPSQVAMTSPTTVTSSMATATGAGTIGATTGNTAPGAAPISATASSFSLGKLNWPLIIVIILIVAAIAIWLWWDDSDDKRQPVVVVKGSTPSPTPAKPVQAQPLQSTNQASPNSNQAQNANRQPSNPQTPLSSAISAPPQGNH